MVVLCCNFTEQYDMTMRLIGEVCQFGSRMTRLTILARYLLCYVVKKNLTLKINRYEY